MSDKKTNFTKQLSIRSIHFFMACLILGISVLLLFVTFNAKSGYYLMRENTDIYIRWEQDANDLQAGSDYLTEQVRCFVETGKREYLNNYFEEADVTRRRDKALENIHTYFGDTEAYQSIERAMNQSVELMNREYYAMRLTIAAYGYDYTGYPKEIQAVELSEEDALASPERQGERARAMVFDDVYHQRKAAISQNVQSCLSMLAEEVNTQQAQITNRLDGMLHKQRLLIFTAITITLLTMLLTMLLVVSPLLRAVFYIRADEPIPIMGSGEFQFLARAYNLMYEANREQKEQLAFDATHDKLTGIYKRSGYDFFLRNTDWETSCLLLFDVDKFKEVNDTYGHEMGDGVLKRVAAAIRDSFRSQDYTCRIGGDEFAVIMVHTDPAHAELVHGKVQRINDRLGQEAEGMPAVHLSCGVAYGAALGNNTAQLFKNADAALYAVKRAGGRGCRVYE